MTGVLRVSVAALEIEAYRPGAPTRVQRADCFLNVSDTCGFFRLA